MTKAAAMSNLALAMYYLSVTILRFKYPIHTNDGRIDYGFFVV